MATTLEEKLDEVDNEVKWLHANYNELINKHNQEFVAIKNEGIIEHAKELESLKVKLEGKGIKTSDVLIEFIRDKRNQVN